MKRTDLLGTTFFISGILLFGIIHFAIATYVPYMGGWGDPPGKLATARNEIMVNFPYFLSILLMVLGLVLLFLKELTAFFKRVF